MEGKAPVFDVKQTVGFADCCELLAAAFAFPNQSLADAIADDSFSGDARECLSDAGIRGCAPLEALLRKADFDGAQELFEGMRQGYTALYLVPGGETPVWPYESAFRHRAMGFLEAPALFRTPCQLDVERHMRNAGVMPHDARKEPTDSVWNELSFLSFLFGNEAAALYDGRNQDVDAWKGRIASFWDEHASQWLPSFMEQTKTQASSLPRAAVYAAFADLGLVVLERIDAEIRKDHQ